MLKNMFIWFGDLSTFQNPKIPNEKYTAYAINLCIVMCIGEHAGNIYYTDKYLEVWNEIENIRLEIVKPGVIQIV